jgi:hypothetical protein
MRPIYAILLIAACAVMIAASQDEARYQIATARYSEDAKSSPAEVWRLDTRTGEICIYSKSLVPGMQIAMGQLACLPGNEVTLLRKLPVHDGAAEAPAM